MRFDRCAHTYDAHAAPQRAFAARVMEFVRLRPQEATLELGAGTGALTIHLCRIAGASVRATDASPAMIRLGRAAVPEAEWFALDAFHAPLPTALPAGVTSTWAWLAIEATPENETPQATA